jgi:hypothetical protein
MGKGGERRTISERLQFIEVDETGQPRKAGYAPYLDYQPLTPDLREKVLAELGRSLAQDDSEEKVQTFAVTQLVPEHLKEIEEFQKGLIQKTRQAVHARLTKEIAYWDRRANDLKAQELAGKKPRLNSGKARERADKLELRLRRRMEELELEAQIAPKPPVIIGGALILPQGYLKRFSSESETEPPAFARETKESELLAMAAVMEAETRAGRIPKDVSADKCGYDIESGVPGSGKLLFIEVKARMAGAATVTITKNEIMTALNKPENFVLAIVTVEDGKAGQPRYVRKPFLREPDFGVTSVNYDLKELLRKTE